MSSTIIALLVGMVLQCPVCDEARDRIEDGDTAAAIEMLRESVEDLREERQDPPAEMAGLLGELLVHTSESRAVEFEERSEAQRLLDLAVRGDSDNPRWWYAMGLLERKRGLQLDAIRYLDRALSLAEENPGVLTLAEESRAWAEKGRAREEHVLDFRGFMSRPEELPGLDRNLERPDWFHRILFSFDTQDHLVDDDQEKMRKAFATAFELDPSHPMAARSWLGVLARGHEWPLFLDVAREHAEATNGEPWPLVFLGAGLHRSGREQEADSVVSLALADLSDEDRKILTDVGEILRRREAELLADADDEKRNAMEGLVWSRLDPFYLTSANERWLEHVTRVALAELWYGDPRIHERGALTEPGIIFIRYGEPKWIRQIQLGEGGRWVFWTYSMNTPSYVFQKEVGSRRIQLAPGSGSAQLEETMRERQPSSYLPDNFQVLQHQVALFKGTDADVEADVILGVPSPPDDAEGSVPARAGVFIVPNGPEEDPAGLRTSLDLSSSGGHAATFRLPVNRGRYAYSAEVLADDGSVRAAGRGTIEAAEFGAGELYLSDLLVADSIRPARPEPEERRHFRISASPDQTFEKGSPLAVYFEIYGLEEDHETSRYDVEVRVQGEEGEGLFGGIVRRIGEIVGSADEGGTVRWSGTAEGEPERVPEWFTLSLPELEPGTYTIQVRVRDTVKDREAAASRTVTFESAEGGA